MGIVVRKDYPELKRDRYKNKATYHITPHAIPRNIKIELGIHYAKLTHCKTGSHAAPAFTNAAARTNINAILIFVLERFSLVSRLVILYYQEVQN